MNCCFRLISLFFEFIVLTDLAGLLSKEDLAISIYSVFANCMSPVTEIGVIEPAACMVPGNSRYASVCLYDVTMFEVFS